MTRWILYGIVGTALLAASVLVIYAPWDDPLASVNDRARDIVKACASSADRSRCYEQHVPALLSDLPLVQIFEVVRAIRQRDDSYKFCHVLAHKLGERIVAEDPNSWIEAIPLNPSDGLCSNGFIHGVVGGRFRAEVLDDATIGAFVPDFARACAPRDGWDPSDLDRAICYHGLGHLYDFITNADLSKALDICARTTPEQFRRVCIEGVFMQIYQPLEPDDFLMIEQMPVKPTAGTVRQFCALFRSNPAYEGACIRESWPMYEGITDGTGVASLCADQPNAEEETACYQSATAIIGRLSLGDTEKTATACTQLPNERQALCFATAAQAVLEENRDDASEAVALCAMAQPSISRTCMETLRTQAPFIFGNNRPALRAFCAALPVELRAPCASQ